MPACMCTGRCRLPPYTCSGKDEPDFLTEAQKRAHRRAYERGETAWSSPFEPWVVRSWARFSHENGLKEHADRIRENLLAASRISNDPSLSTRQKKRKLARIHGKGKNK